MSHCQTQKNNNSDFFLSFFILLFQSCILEMAKCRNGRENVHSKDGGGGEKLPVVCAHLESCGRHVLSMTCSHTRRWQIFKVESVWVPLLPCGPERCYQLPPAARPLSTWTWTRARTNLNHSCLVCAPTKNLCCNWYKALTHDLASANWELRERSWELEPEDLG